MQGGEEDMEERKPSKAVVPGDARLSLTQGELWSIIFVPRHRALNYMPFQNAETAPRVQVP